MHKQLAREDDKKFFYRSVSVKEGEAFSIKEVMDTSCASTSNMDMEDEKLSNASFQSKKSTTLDKSMVRPK